jgi:ATP-dependent helicase HrpB
MLMALDLERIEDVREARFDAARERVIGVAELRYDGLALEQSEVEPSEEDAARVLAEAAVSAGVGRFCDEGAWIALSRRLRFARTFDPSLPELDDAWLRALLVRLCEGKRSFGELERASLLDWVRTELAGASARLDAIAPEAVVLAGRRRVPVTYEEDRPPWIASRLADFFGMSEGPAVAQGRVPLVLHLLAPNRRALQVTTDLAGFWERHYPELRRSLMRRYPRHPWPEDPRTASPPEPRRTR